MAERPEIICYSRTGHSRHLADQIVIALKGSLQVVTTPKYGWPIVGWFSAGQDGIRGAAAPLNETLRLPGRRGLAVLVGPVWVAKPAAPLNTVIDQLKGTHTRVAAALACGQRKQDPAPLDVIEQRLGRALVAGLVIANPQNVDLAESAALKRFVVDCQSGVEWLG